MICYPKLACFYFFAYFCAMRYFLYFFFFALSCATQAQSPQDSLSIQIPADWVGKWAGKLNIVNSQGNTNAVNMELHISRHDSTDRWNWTIVYGEGERRQERKYQLLSQKPAKGWYKIDEKNGIILDAFFAQNTLANIFEVENNMLTTLYRREGKHLVFEVFMCVTKSPNLTGGNKPDVPVVRSYPVRVLQRAVLKKMKATMPEKSTPKKAPK